MTSAADSPPNERSSAAGYSAAPPRRAVTIAKALKEHGILPPPQRPTSWRIFFRSHADVIAGTDFFTTEVWTSRGLVTYHVLFHIKHATRAVNIA